MSNKVTITVRLSAPLSERIDSRGEITVEAATVRDSLEQVAEKYPEFRKLIWTDHEQINPALLVFHHDDKISTNNLDILLKEDDQIDVIPAISGG